MFLKNGMVENVLDRNVRYCNVRYHVMYVTRPHTSPSIQKTSQRIACAPYCGMCWNTVNEDPFLRIRCNFSIPIHSTVKIKIYLGTF